MEREITEEAIAQFEAEPDAIREAGIVVAAGDGWHEGVVGIVASRLVERFERPAIVIARDGATAKGSGRSLAGVDLHGLVGAASGTLTRWGGHQGAVGLELPAERIARFRDDLILAAEGARAAIARARVRTVDAVVGARDLTLQTAEALEALAPFGRGNPPVRLALPGAELESPARVGQGRHLQVRLRSGGVNARAIGFRMGEKAAGIALDERHDALISLEIERWQGLVGPRVAVDALERIPARDVLPGGCAQGCDIACPDRVGGDALRALVLDGDDPDGLAGPPPPPAAAPPVGVRDRRGQGASLAVLASLAGADRGAVAVVADVARRRGALETALEPGRLGLEVAVLAGGRCDPGAMAARIALARGVPGPADGRVRPPRRGRAAGGHAPGPGGPAGVAGGRGVGGRPGGGAVAAPDVGGGRDRARAGAWRRRSGSCARRPPPSGPACATGPSARGARSWSGRSWVTARRSAGPASPRARCASWRRSAWSRWGRTASAPPPTRRAATWPSRPSTAPAGTASPRPAPTCPAPRRSTSSPAPRSPSAPSPADAPAPAVQ